MLVAPVIVVLTIFVWICSALLYCSAWVFGLTGMVLGIFGVLALITHQVTNGIILLVMAFLVSPFGIPMAAAWLIGKIQDLRYAILDRVYG
jgi:steroid 5-alpha reductase family enzyme